MTLNRLPILFLIAGSCGLPLFAQTPCDCSLPLERLHDVIPDLTGQPGDFFERRSGAEVDASIKIYTDGTGIRSLGFDELVAAGVSASDLIGSRLRLFHFDQEVAIQVSTAGAMGPGDELLFYAVDYEDTHSASNVYWLGLSDSGSGLRWGTRDATPIAGQGAITTACHRVFLDPQGQFYGNIRAPFAIDDGWLAGFAQRDTFGTDQRMALAFPGTEEAIGFGSLQLEVSVEAALAIYLFPTGAVRAVSNLDVDVLEGSGTNLLGQMTLPLPKTPTTITASVDLSPFIGDLSPGVLSFRSQAPTGTVEAWTTSFFVNTAQLDFERRLTAIDGRLNFAGRVGNFNYAVNGVALASPMVLDVSNPHQPVALENITAGGAGWTFGANAGSTPCFHASDPGAIVRVAASELEVGLPDPATRNTATQADYLLIVPRALDGITAADWIAYRQADGLTVQKVIVEEIYDTFSYGVKTPDAIRAFLGFARHHYQDPRPGYVCLVGDGDSDPRNIVNARPDLVPAKLLSFVHTKSFSDHWMGDVLAPLDGIPDLAMGRLPIRSEVEFRTLLTKTQTYEAQAGEAWRDVVSLYADEPTLQGGSVQRICTSGLFPTSCIEFDLIQEESAQTLQAAGMATDLITLDSNGGNMASVQNQIENAFDEGRSFISIQSYSSWVTIGLRPNFQGRAFDADTAQNLSNARLPLVLFFGSVTGATMVYDGHSMAEALLLNPNGGAAGVLGETSIPALRVGRLKQLGFIDALVNRRVPIARLASNNLAFEARPIERIGDVIQAAMRWQALSLPQPGSPVNDPNVAPSSSTSDPSFSHSFIWLGDPALRFESLAPAVEINDMFGPNGQLRTQWQGRAGVQYRLLEGERLDDINNPVGIVNGANALQNLPDLPTAPSGNVRYFRVEALAAP